MKPEIICNRCNDFLSEATKCTRENCEHPGYHQAMIERFRDRFPPKYYCSFTGAINSGKTYYLLSLVNILLERTEDTNQLLKSCGIADIDIIDPVSLDLYHKLLNECKNGQLKFTIPLAALGFFSLIMTFTDGREYEIVLFNSSGERIEDEYKADKYKDVSHDRKGAVTLYFVDPKNDSGLNSLLLKPNCKEECLDIKLATHIYKVMKAVNNGVRIVTNPLAVCISKFDLLEHRIFNDVPEHVYVEAHHHDFFGEIQRNSRRISDFLQAHSRTVKPVELEEKFSTLSYFALAPFGIEEPPAYWEQKQSRGILAPFLWALKKRGIIKEENDIF